MKKEKIQHRVIWLGRLSMGVVFIWFGLLKIIGVSPANDLVRALLEKTLPFIPFSGFIVFLGMWEALIGLLFLFPKLTKWAFLLLIAQMITTLGPLVLLPDMAWQQFLLVPTLEGQYILKNLVLISLGAMLYVQRHESA